MGNKSILLVEDDAPLRCLVEHHLQLEGYQVLLAEEGACTLTTALTLHPDLIMLDVMLPEMGGFAIYKQLRADPNTTHIPIVVFTARKLMVDRLFASRHDTDDYLTKSFEIEELKTRVAKTIGQPQ